LLRSGKTSILLCSLPRFKEQKNHSSITETRASKEVIQGSVFVDEPSADLGKQVIISKTVPLYSRLISLGHNHFTFNK